MAERSLEREHESELQNEDKNHCTNGDETADFLSLAAAKTKKKKPQKIPLFELNNPTLAKRFTIRRSDVASYQSTRANRQGERGGFFGSKSRANDSESWVSKKKSRVKFL
ncbi:hypothetical protein ACSBR2_018280 [Camellia fascicularis]